MAPNVRPGVILTTILSDTFTRITMTPEKLGTSSFLEGEYAYVTLAPGGVGSPQLYNQLLALYLLHNEMCQAKFLWKRIPPAVKSTTPELTTIWAAGQKMWQRDYTGSYEALKKEYSAEVKPIMEAALEAYRRRAFHLVSQAYSSINADELATFLGMPTSEAVQAAQAEGWDADVHTRFITPKKPVGVKPDPEFKSDQQLSILTDYVSFLES